MPFIIQIQGNFSSAHRLLDYHGNCENLHGHNWKVVVKIKASELDKSGMLIDFSIAEKILYSTLRHFDHKYLNEVPPFDNLNPTAENIAKHIFDILSDEFNQNTILVAEVAVWEDDTSCAIYSID
jgi:6-pyruvoyltetrahydropterin/6-carboxytetrahydropterin synthase